MMERIAARESAIEWWAIRLLFGMFRKYSS